MRVLGGAHVRVRIYIGESDKWHHQPLALALIERLRKEGFAGATVFQGLAGFGAHSVLHTTQLLRLSQDLPVVVEVIEAKEMLPKLSGIVEEMVGEGLVTIEEGVHVVKYAPGAQAVGSST